MKGSWDKEYDLAYIRFTDVVTIPGGFTVPLIVDEIERNMINLDFSHEKKLLGLESLCASKELHRDTLAGLVDIKIKKKVEMWVKVIIDKFSDVANVFLADVALDEIKITHKADEEDYDVNDYVIRFNLHFDHEGRLIIIEMHEASKHLPKELLNIAVEGKVQYDP